MGNSQSDQVRLWTGQVQAIQKMATRRGWLSFLIGGLGPLVVAALAFVFVPEQRWVFCIGLLGSIIAWPVMHSIWVAKARKRAAGQLGDQIRQVCEAEGLSRTEVVEALAAQVPKGPVRQEVLAAVDPEAAAIMGLRDRGLAVLSKKGAKEEKDALELRALTLECLAHKLYSEAIASLGMVSTIYAEIAPSFPDGVNVDVLIKGTFDQAQRVALATRKVLSSFEFEADLKAILEASTKRRSASLLKLLLAAQGGEADATVALAEAGEGLKPLIRDPVWVGACIDYLGERATRMIQAVQALALLPDVRTVPYLFKAFDLLPFYPQGIDALNRLGESAHPQLLEALRTGSPNLRYNVALALGIMEVEGARPIFAGLLDTQTHPLERIGCCYGLVKLGEAERLDEIVRTLEHADGDIRHAAAIALEHLSQPLADAVYLRHLTDANKLVRLRLARKLGVQGTDNPALIDALIARLGDSDEDVRSAAVDAVAKLGAEKVYDRMVGLAASSTGTTRECAYQVLGKLADPQAKALLIDALAKYAPADQRRAILSALADLQAVEAAQQVGRYLSDKELSAAAFWALLRIGFQDREAVTPILRRHTDQAQRLFALAILGDEKARGQLKGMLSSATGIQTLLQVCDYARMLSSPEFEAPLRKLLNYTNQTYTPTDKFIPYAAFKALIHTLLAKA